MMPSGVNAARPVRLLPYLRVPSSDRWQELSGIKKLVSNKSVRNIAQKAAETVVFTDVAVDAQTGRNVCKSFRERNWETLLSKLTDSLRCLRPKCRERNNLRPIHQSRRERSLGLL